MLVRGHRTSSYFLFRPALYLTKVFAQLYRFLIPLRLEHQTTVRLRPRLVPILLAFLVLFRRAPATPFTIHNLGQHHPLHRPISTESLLLLALKVSFHETYLLDQIQTSEKQEFKPTRDHPPPEPETKVPDLRSIGTSGRAGERDVGGRLECAAVGRGLDVDTVGESRAGEVEVEGIDRRQESGI